MPVVLKRINVYAARPHMDFFALAVVGYVDSIPAHVNLFAFIGIDNVDTVRKGNVDEWLVAATGVVGRILILFGLIRRLGSSIAVLRAVSVICGLPIQQLIQRHAIQRGECNEVIGIGRGFAALPFADSLATHAQLGGKRLLRKPGSLAAIDEALCHRKIHGGSFREVTVIE